MRGMESTQNAREGAQDLLACPLSFPWKWCNDAFPLPQLHHTAPSTHSSDTEALTSWTCALIPAYVIYLSILSSRHATMKMSEASCWQNQGGTVGMGTNIAERLLDAIPCWLSSFPLHMLKVMPWNGHHHFLSTDWHIFRLREQSTCSENPRKAQNGQRGNFVELAGQFCDSLIIKINNNSVSW